MIFANCPALLQHQLRNNAYFSPYHRLLFVATPKVACTGFKWWFAEILGVSAVISKANVSLESDPELVIHDTFAQVAPEYTGANEAGLAEALASPEYFRFCLVRNPYARAFSAWQSKWLLHEHLQSNAYPIALGERAIESVADIRSAFEAFLRLLVTVDGPELHDVHVAPQTALLEPGLVPYHAIAHIEDPSDLLKALSARLGPAFRSPLSGGRANVSLLPYSSAWITDDAASLIRTIYARDFEVFGYDLGVPSGVVDFAESTVALGLRAIKLLRGRNARIGELIQRQSVGVPGSYRLTAMDSTLQLYWSEIRDGKATSYAEERSAFELYQFDGMRRTLQIFFPNDLGPVHTLRLDPSNQPAAVVLHAISIETCGGQPLWRWDGRQDAVQGGLGLVFRRSQDGLVVLCFNDDPQFGLSIPQEILARVESGARLVVELTPRPLLDVLPALFAESERPQEAESGVASTFLAPVGVTQELVEIAQLMKGQVQRRNETISRQREELDVVQARQKALEAQVMRSEAQLDVLKEFVLSTFGKTNERI